MRRSIAAVLAAINLLNGLVMLFAGPFWWNGVPGVTETGPYNPHFVQDVGAAFLAAGLALGARAWRTQYWPAAVAGAAFLVVHALLALNPIFSADKILRFFAGIAGKNAGRAIRLVPTMINGTAGAIVYMDDEIDHALSLAVEGEKITTVYLVRNPDKLRHVAAVQPPQA